MSNQAGKDIIVDIDGVIVDFTSAFIKKATELLGISNLYYSEIKEHNLDRVLGIPKDIVKNIVHEVISEGSFDPINGAKESLTVLEQAGYNIHIITNRDPEHKSTLEWLEDNEIPFSSLEFCEDSNKALHCRKCDILIDDSIDVILSSYPYVKKAILFNQPWNSYTLNVCGHFFRAMAWDHVLDILL